MQRPLREHIAYLEQKSEAIKQSLLDPDRSTSEKLQLHIDLDMAQRALGFFRKAFDLEQQISH
jgi:hypothetical protein